MRRLAIGLALSCAVLALSAPAAGAAITRIHISLSATVTKHVHVTQSDYTCPGASAPASGDLTEQASVKTTRASTMVVIPGVGTSLAIQPQTDMNNSDRILTHGTITRTSTLSAHGQPTCGEDPASCGTKPFSLMSLVGAGDNGRNGRRFRGISLNSFEGPRGPFSACSSPFPALPDALYRTVPFPVSFMRSCRHGKMTKRLTRTDSFTDPAAQARGDTSVALTVTVTRLGPLRGYRC